MAFSFGEISNVDRSWEMPAISSLLHRLASSSRIMVFDRHGNRWAFVHQRGATA
jgi:hypothetical protein